MNTAIVITKTDPDIKKQAQEIAKEIGVSLSSLVHAYLKQLVRNRSVEFHLDENPSPFMRQSVKRAEEDISKGHVSPPFKSAQKAVDWLEKQGI